MNPEELKELIDKWETTKIDFKEVILNKYPNVKDQRERDRKREESIAELVKDISAIANSDGERENGYLIVGIREKTRRPVKGGARVDRRKVRQHISRRINPPVKVSYETVPFMGEPIEVIEIITDRNQRPHQITHGIDEGKIFLRKGDNTEVASVTEIAGMIQARVSTYYGYEHTPISTLSVDDLDGKRIEGFLTSEGEIIDSQDVFGRLLVKYGLATPEGYPTLKGALIFGKNPQRGELSYCTVDMAVYEEGNPDPFGTIRIEGTIPSQIRKAREFFLKYSLSDKVPMIAFRECLINALIHRDYYHSWASISVNIYPDHLVITSPGTLIGGLTEDDLNDESFQIPQPPPHRNKSLVDTLSRLSKLPSEEKIVELIGSGINRAREDLRRLGIKEMPRFSEDKERGVFRVTISAPFLKPFPLSITPEGLSKNEIEVFNLIKVRGKITKEEIEEGVKISSRTVSRCLKSLMEKDIIEMFEVLGESYFRLQVKS